MKEKKILVNAINTFNGYCKLDIDEYRKDLKHLVYSTPNIISIDIHDTGKEKFFYVIIHYVYDIIRSFYFPYVDDVVDNPKIYHIQEITKNYYMYHTYANILNSYSFSLIWKGNMKEMTLNDCNFIERFTHNCYTYIIGELNETNKIRNDLNLDDTTFNKVKDYISSVLMLEAIGE